MNRIRPATGFRPFGPNLDPVNHPPDHMRLDRTRPALRDHAMLRMSHITGNFLRQLVTEVLIDLKFKIRMPRMLLPQGRQIEVHQPARGLARVKTRGASGKSEFWNKA